MSNLQNPSLILASTSIYRRELLERLRIPFSVISPKVDETPLAGESSLDLALRLANAKAGAVAKENPNGILLALFFQAKSDELLGVFSGADMGEKANALAILRRCDPSNSTKYDKLVKN